MRCLRLVFQPYEYEWTCFSCGYNVVEKNIDLTETQGKKNFINRLKFSRKKCAFAYMYTKLMRVLIFKNRL